jgi:hypothetical protein
VKPVRPLEPRAGAVRRRFVRGREQPRGVVWFGARSFWGHLRHFVAAAIATEDVDSRDWMTADPPEELAERVARELGVDAKPDLLSGLGRDLWIDYVSDTGDDVAVSRAVARLLFASYTLPALEHEGEEVTAPRGDILIFGGDTAYPVATAQEITNRVLVPYNQVLEELGEGTDAPRKRVLLGLPGNHDWYDGLDGFGRLFRRRPEGEEEARPSVVGFSERMLYHYTEWAREFMKGGKVEKPRTLALSGYVAVQNASYFVLPLSDRIHLYGVDRQLRNVDLRQQRFMLDWYRSHPDAYAWFMLPDPVYRFAGPSRTGTAMVQALGLDFDAKSHFVLSGDIHHYQRLRRDRLLHVIAGGGGAFLHPAPLARRRVQTEVEWPNREQSRALLPQVPWKIARGRSGFLPHLLLVLLFAPTLAMSWSLPAAFGLTIPLPVVSAVVLWTILALIGGVRRGGRKVALLSLAAALLIASLPSAASYCLAHALGPFGFDLDSWLIGIGALLATAFLGTFLFGAYLSLLTLWGFEHTQAFTALDHPGYKHFLRLRVRADGRGIDGYCIGLTDPLGPDARPELVDSFTWRPAEEVSRRSMVPQRRPR